MKVLSVVCARAGSKGLRNKCITRIDNKMVIEYSIGYSLSLGKDVETVVSTDIAEVIDYCKTKNIKYIKRDSRLCKDETKIDDVLADAIGKNKETCTYCSLVYGNIPTRYPRIFREALEFLDTHVNYDAVISMQNVQKFHPEWMFDFNNNALPKMSDRHYRRQTLPPKMIHDGHTLIFKSDKFLKKFKNLTPYDRRDMYAVFGDNIKPMINDEVIVDIDRDKDMKIARAILAINQ